MVSLFIAMLLKRAFGSFLATRVTLWSAVPVGILKDFMILSGLIVNIRSICVLVEFLVLVGPRRVSVRLNLFVICFRFFSELPVFLI